MNTNRVVYTSDKFIPFNPEKADSEELNDWAQKKKK